MESTQRHIATDAAAFGRYVENIRVLGWPGRPDQRYVVARLEDLSQARRLMFILLFACAELWPEVCPVDAEAGPAGGRADEGYGVVEHPCAHLDGAARFVIVGRSCSGRREAVARFERREMARETRDLLEAAVETFSTEVRR